MIDLRYVRKLLEMIDASSVNTIDISSDKGLRIRVSKNSHRPQVQIAAPLAMPQMVAPQAALPPKAEAPKLSLLEVKSPMVGTYYAAPEPGAKPYLGAGDRISKGQILCIIEAMKIMNEIEADAAGTIREILCENGQAVEFGQPLFVIE